MKAKLSMVMVLLLVVVIFTVQNAETVTITFFLWQFTLSRALMFFLIFAVGVLLGFFLCLVQQRTNGKELEKTQNKSLEEDNGS